MKERPILFSAPMVRALFAGTKTQTRRALKHQPTARHQLYTVTHGGSMVVAVKWIPNTGDDGPNAVLCPYGVPGDHLWVKETWRAPTSCDHLPPRSISDTEPLRFVADEFVGADAGFGKARPSIFMPRWASRITLEVTDVRVERLQDISEADAIAEGVAADASGRPDDDAAGFHRIGRVRDDSFPIARYAALWESINGAGSWDANPFVWVVKFKRLP